MFLRKFILSDKQGKIIREVNFKKGLNIILGEAESQTGTATNSLGKTTLIRCIDFCLGAKSADDLYKDSESNISNAAVENFLKKSEPTFTLHLASSFNSDSQTIISRQLNLNKSKNKIKNTINGQEIKEGKFKEELLRILFGISGTKPSLRQLLGKFIRNKDYEISSILFFAYRTTPQEYEKIHLVLLGFEETDLLSNKGQVEREVEKLSKTIRDLEKIHNNVSLSQGIEVLQKEANQLNQQIESFCIDDAYNEEARKLEDEQILIRELSQKISSVRIKIDFNTKQINQLKKNHLNTHSSNLLYLYEEAKYFSKNLPKTFDDLVVFHNTMLDKEISYLEKTNSDYHNTLIELESSYSEHLERYNKLLSFLGNKGSLAEYTKLNEKLREIVQKIGEKKSLLEERTALKEKVNSREQKRQKIVQAIADREKTLKDKLSIFNKYFTEYTGQLTSGQKYLLSYTKTQATNKDLYKFKIDLLDDNNPGSGLKHAVVIAFDLAYISFSNETGLQRPQFVTSDKVEEIDDENLKTLIKIANTLEGQFIVPMIKDRLVGFKDIQNDVILSLSSNNKFFKIES